MVMTITSVTNPHCGYLKQFEYVVDLNINGVPSRYIEWCNANCNYYWGWHFWQNERAKELSKLPWSDDWLPPNEVTEGTRAFMSFESYDEMIQFKIINLSG
jgi:hypothetical protein